VFDDQQDQIGQMCLQVLVFSPIGCKRDLDEGDMVIRRSTPLKQGIRRSVEDPQDQAKSKHEGQNQDRRKDQEEMKSSERNRELRTLMISGSEPIP
jgi:hypothetical protein